MDSKNSYLVSISTLVDSSYFFYKVMDFLVENHIKKVINPDCSRKHCRRKDHCNIFLMWFPEARQTFQCNRCQFAYTSQYIWCSRSFFRVRPTASLLYFQLHGNFGDSKTSIFIHQLPQSFNVACLSWHLQLELTMFVIFRQVSTWKTPILTSFSLGHSHHTSLLAPIGI